MRWTENLQIFSFFYELLPFLQFFRLESGHLENNTAETCNLASGDSVFSTWSWYHDTRAGRMTENVKKRTNELSNWDDVTYIL